MATKPTPKKVVVKQLMKTPTRKVEEVTRIEPKKPKPIDEKKSRYDQALKNISSKGVNPEGSFAKTYSKIKSEEKMPKPPFIGMRYKDSTVERLLPTPKKPTIVQKVVSKLKKKK